MILISLHRVPLFKFHEFYILSRISETPNSRIGRHGGVLITTEHQSSHLGTPTWPPSYSLSCLLGLSENALYIILMEGLHLHLRRSTHFRNGTSDDHQRPHVSH